MEDFAQWPLWAQVLTIIAVFALAIGGFLGRMKQLADEANKADRTEKQQASS